MNKVEHYLQPFENHDLKRSGQNQVLFRPETLLEASCSRLFRRWRYAADDKFDEDYGSVPPWLYLCLGLQALSPSLSPVAPLLIFSRLLPNPLGSLLDLSPDCSWAANPQLFSRLFPFFLFCFLSSRFPPSPFSSLFFCFLLPPTPPCGWCLHFLFILPPKLLNPCL